MRITDEVGRWVFSAKLFRGIKLEEKFESQTL